MKEGEGELSGTHPFASVLDKSVPAGLSAQCTGLVKEVVQPCEFSKLGEYLYECVSGMIQWFNLTEDTLRDELIHSRMEIADIKTVLKQLEQRRRRGTRGRRRALRGFGCRIRKVRRCRCRCHSSSR